MCTQSPAIDPLDIFRVLGERARALHRSAQYPVLPGEGALAVDRLDLSGQWLGDHYQLLRPLGQRVTLYQARCAAPGAPRLVRVVLGLASEAERDAFLRRARAAAQLHHGHIARITDVGLDTLTDGSIAGFVVMEPLRGENLTGTLLTHGPLPWPRVLAIARDICRALIAAHARGVVHGDLKLANCLRLTRPGAPDFIKVLDFGLSAGASTASADDDVRALGGMMHRLLTGQAPGHDPSLAPGSLGPGVPPAVAAVVLAALGSGPTPRPLSARSLHRALVDVASPPPKPVTVTTGTPASLPPARVATVDPAPSAAPPASSITAVARPAPTAAPSPARPSSPSRDPWSSLPPLSADTGFHALTPARADWHDWLFWIPLGATTMLFLLSLLRSP